jgi:2-polyprenyl-6-methoxyphenol hydroxylase-like FAD-dependent oxidoreductase
MGAPYPAGTLPQTHPQVIAVVGAGIAGLSCALAAARAGATVRVYESRHEVAGLPAHVDVVPNMLRDLVLLGVADTCVRVGFPYRRTVTVGQRGKPLFALDASRLAGARYPAALGMTHAELRDVLATAAVKAGAELHAGVTVRNVDPGTGNAAGVLFADGTSAEADLVVLACGAGQELRQQVFGAPAPSASGLDWFYFLSPRPPRLDEAVNAGTFAGDKVHLVPVGASTLGVRLASAGGRARLDARGAKALLGSFPGPAGEVAALLRDDFAVVRRQATPGLLAAPWVRGRVIAVGDCAHALPPHFGQSAAQGVEDAVVLGDLVASGIHCADIPCRFTERRLARVQGVMAITMQAARWDVMPEEDTDLLQLSRDLEAVVRDPA